MQSNRGWNKCAYCGKFFSVKEFNEGKVKCNYTPDTSFSSEDESFFYHVKCELEDNHEVH